MLLNKSHFVLRANVCFCFSILQCRYDYKVVGLPKLWVHQNNARTWPQCFKCHFYAWWRLCCLLFKGQNHQDVGSSNRVKILYATSFVILHFMYTIAAILIHLILCSSPLISGIKDCRFQLQCSHELKNFKCQCDQNYPCSCFWKFFVLNSHHKFIVLGGRISFS